MRRFQRSWCALAVLALAAPGIRMAVAQDAPPPDPVAIARRCIHHVTMLANTCVQQNLETARALAPRIQALLEQGETQKARAVAARGIQAVNARSRECLGAIQAACERCTKAIADAGGTPEMIEAVKAACRRQAERVERSRHAAVELIRKALGGDGGGE